MLGHYYLVLPISCEARINYILKHLAFLQVHTYTASLGI